MDTIQQPAQGPKGVYVHVPWCAHRCPYCDFYLRVGRPDAAFVDRVLDQWTHTAPLLGPGAVLHSVYLGGGTPGLLPVADVARLLQGVAARAPLEPGAEITLEANPNDCTAANVAGWKAAGVTRVSLGVQALDDATLKGLGRDHRAAGAWEAMGRVAAAGFVSWSADLIFGHPAQTAAALDQALERTAAVAPHVSAYCLTYEAGTTLDKWRAKGRVVPVSNAQEAALYEQVQGGLARYGFAQYEVSSHARPGHAAVHNRLYWEGETTLGLGPAAASYVRRANGSARRWRHAPELTAFLEGAALAALDVEDMTAGQALVDRVFTGLRDLERGVDLGKLEAQHGVPVPAAVEAVLQRHAQQGALWRDARRFGLTAAGALWADRVARDVLHAA